LHFIIELFLDFKYYEILVPTKTNDEELEIKDILYIIKFI